jgi:hypothetical protein
MSNLIFAKNFREQGKLLLESKEESSLAINSFF